MGVRPQHFILGAFFLLRAPTHKLNLQRQHHGKDWQLWILRDLDWLGYHGASELIWNWNIKVVVDLNWSNLIPQQECLLWQKSFEPFRGMQRDVYKIKSQGLRPNTSGCQADPWGAPFSSKGSLCRLRLSSRNPPLQCLEYQQIRDKFGPCGWSRHPPGSFALVFLPFFFLRFAFLCWSAFVSWGSSMEQPAVPNANLNDAIFNK